MPDRVDARLSELGIVLPEPTFPHDPLDAGVVHVHDVFGDAGRHTRSAIGVAALPRGAAVEIELTVAIRS